MENVRGGKVGQYFSIHNHSDYSNASLGFADSINTVKKSVDYALELGLSGYVLSDHEILGGHLQLMKYRDRLIKEGKITHEDFTIGFGDEAYLVEEILDGPQKFYHHLWIAKDKIGHEMLKTLSSIAWENSFTKTGLVRTPTLRADVENVVERFGRGHLISSTACLGSYEAQAFLRIKELEENGGSEGDINNIKAGIEEFVLWNKEYFGDDFYLEIAPNISDEQRYVNRRVWTLGKAYNVPVVFSTDSHYLTEEDRELHKAYLNSKQAEREVDAFYYTSYMMGYDKVKEYFMLDFSENDFQEMIDNLEKLRKSLTHYDLYHEQEIPKVKVVVPNLSSEVNIEQVEKFDSLMQMLNSREDQDLYWVRTCLNEMVSRNVFNDNYLDELNIEANTLIKISDRLKQPMSSYYNTAQKIVDILWTKGDSYVGISRGSAFGFLSNWLLDITQMDPIPYVGKISWRHLSESRPELPDVDIDSQGTKREQILQALKNYFGEDRVLNIATFGTEGAKSALATAARGLGLSDDIAKYLSGMIINERGFDRSLHDMIFGDGKDVKPVKEFVNEISQYPLYAETALAIEGLVKSRGSHASGVYIFNHDYTQINAMMKAPSGQSTTQWDYHDSDEMGALKFDMLSIEALDKMRATMDLLQADGRIEWQGSLRDTYNKYIHPTNMSYESGFWKPTWNNEVIDLFQLDTAVGKQAMSKAQPADLKEVADLNSLMRLMAQPGAELPLEKYARFKHNIQLWYKELKAHNIPENEIPILEKHYLPSMGVPNAQEHLMLAVMDEAICGLTEMDANVIRKVIGKKQMEKIPEVREQIFSSSKLSPQATEYFWSTMVETQLGYSFSLLHTLAYSAIGLQELNLYNRFPSIYWNTGCLNVNSGDEEGSSTDYSKIAVSLGNVIKHGINVDLVDINKSDFNFRPDAEKNRIIYGFRSLSGIGSDIIHKITENRPYSSFEDFMEKVEPSKNQALSLIKSGAFSKIDSENRYLTLAKYAGMKTTRRKNLTITQTPLILSLGHYPPELEMNMRGYEFNRYVKDVLKKDGDRVLLDDRSLDFLNTAGLTDLIDGEGTSSFMSKKEWERSLNTLLNPVRAYYKENKAELLEEIFEVERQAIFEEYGGFDSLGKMEMDSMNFYYSEHELANVDYSYYGIKRFSLLPPEPVKTNPGLKYSRVELSSIVGTIIGKNKVKGTIDLLVPEGDVVMVKMYKGDFSYWDRQISESNGSGGKKVLEKSFLERGNKLYLTGFRRDDQFVPKTYKDTPFPMLGLITGLTEDGKMTLKTSRLK